MAVKFDRHSVPNHDTPMPLRRNVDFMLFYVGQVLSQFGTAVTAFALPVLVLALTGSPAQAGVMAALGRLPYVFLGLPVGVLADRLNRKSMMFWGDAVRAVIVGSLAIACLRQAATVPLLAAVTLVAGVAYVFFDVADNAAFPRLVSSGQLATAASVTEAGVTSANLAGPAVGGIVLGLGATTLVGAGWAYGIDAATFIVAAILTLLIRRRLQADRVAGPSPTRSWRRDLADGAMYLWAHRELRMLAVTNFMFIFALDAAGLGVIVLARQNLHGPGIVSFCPLW